MNERQDAADQLARRARRADATIDRAGQVLSELLAVAGELEDCVGQLVARAASPAPRPAGHPPAPQHDSPRRPRRG